MEQANNIPLENGSRIAVVGGGPAGSMFSFFLLRIAKRADLDLHVDIYEPRDFSVPDKLGGNHCGGIISEWLVQALALEGIILPDTIVQRGLDSYFLHFDVGSVKIETPHQEKRIAAVHRGGSYNRNKSDGGSFDAHLLSMARDAGANWVQTEVVAMQYGENSLKVMPNNKEFLDYDLVVMATGKHIQALKMLAGLDIGFEPPVTAQAYFSKIPMDNAEITRQLGNSMHLFLPDLAKMKFGALIPKRDHVTFCMLGDKISEEVVGRFITLPETRDCMAPDWVIPEKSSHCFSELAISGPHKPYADRLICVGDCSVSRLYKDGIGVAYRGAKAAAVTAVYEGVSEKTLETYYWPTLKSIGRDNDYGRFIFKVAKLVQKVAVIRRGVLRMVQQEQKHHDQPRPMSEILWDAFSGSEPYRDVFWRTLNPLFLLQFFVNMAAGLFKFKSRKENVMYERG